MYKDTATLIRLKLMGIRWLAFDGFDKSSDLFVVSESSVVDPRLADTLVEL